MAASDSSLPPAIKIPPMKDLTVGNITANTKQVNSFNNPSPRLTYILDRLVQHLHDLARETRVTTEEWMTALEFLTATGQTCSDVRQEFILLSDVLGLSLLVDAMNHPTSSSPSLSSTTTRTPLKATESTLLGPFHTHDALEIDGSDHADNDNNNNDHRQLSHDPAGEPLLVLCTVKDTSGRPLHNVKVDVWETDSTGHYDVQHESYTSDRPDGRGIVRSDEKGIFWFKAIVPVSYPIPNDGPVGRLLEATGRHPWRPAHMHFMFDVEEEEKEKGRKWGGLTTALYIKGDPYETSDAVFGVKDSLLVELGHVTEKEMAEQYGVELGRTKLLQYDFVLVSDEESKAIREESAREALKEMMAREDVEGEGGKRVKFVGGLPVFDVD